MIDSTQRSSLVQRMIRAARLEPDLYEEVEADRSATNDALIAVVIVAVCAGIGAGLSRAMHGYGSGVIGAIVGQIIGDIIGWVVWSYVTYFIGTRFFGGRATPGELLRTVGFARSPGVFRIFRFIPVVGGLIALVVEIWSLVAGIVAVRQALDFDTGKAIITTIIGWLVLIAITVLLAILGFGAALLS